MANKIEIRCVNMGGWIVMFIDTKGFINEKAFGSDQWKDLVKYIDDQLNLI